MPSSSQSHNIGFTMILYPTKNIVPFYPASLFIIFIYSVLIFFIKQAQETQLQFYFYKNEILHENISKFINIIHENYAFLLLLLHYFYILVSICIEILNAYNFI